MGETQFLSVQHLPGAVVVTILEGSVIRTADVTRVCEEIHKLIEQTLVRTYVISFSDLTHMSSTFMGHLIALNKKIQTRGGQLVLVDVPPQIREVLTIAQVHKQIPIHDSLAQVLVGRTPPWMTLLGASILGSVAGLSTVGWIAWRGLPGFDTTAHALATLAGILLILHIPVPLLTLVLRLRFSLLFRREQWAVALVGLGLVLGLIVVLIFGLS